MSKQIMVHFDDGTKAEYSESNLSNIRRVFGDRVKKIVALEPNTDEAKEQNALSLAVLKKTAEQLNIKGWKKMTEDQLREAIEQELNPQS